MPTVRFHDQDVVWEVDDTWNVSEVPQTNVFDHKAYVFENVGRRPIDDALAFRAPTRAADVNALGEVPDSTWFTNRIGRHDLSPKDVARGPNVGHSPVDARPWTIVKTKMGGASPGLIIEDVKGVRYILKFDRPGFPEVETGADVVSQRLLWAAGYNVPENEIVYFRASDLVVTPASVRESENGHKIPLTQEHLRDLLTRIDGPNDGLYRGMTSKYLSGRPLGGYTQEGVRSDDPNDLVPHEDRRDIRGQYVFLGWIAHTDIKEDNTLDMWVEDPDDPKVHYVLHYLVDFGSSLGARAALYREPYDGYAYNFDYVYTFGSAVALGAWKRPWEGIADPGIRGVGRFDSEHFDPTRFHSRNRYVPFQGADRYDRFWAAKILMRFGPEHIRAAVEQGRYSDPRAVDYLTKVLIERQRRSGKAWFSQVNPLDGIELDTDHSRLCLTDLWRLYRFDRGQQTSYQIGMFDRHGRRRGPTGHWKAAKTARFCVPLPARLPAEGYLMIRLVTVREGKKLPPVWVHVAAQRPGTDWRIIGLWRE